MPNPGRRNSFPLARRLGWFAFQPRDQSTDATVHHIRTALVGPRYEHYNPMMNTLRDIRSLPTV